MSDAAPYSACSIARARVWPRRSYNLAPALAKRMH